MKSEEKITMELTRGEAMYVLLERLEDKWYVDLEPLFVFAPMIIISYIVYLVASRLYIEWVAWLFTVPPIMFGFLIMYRQFKKRQKKAETLYEEYKRVKS